MKQFLIILVLFVTACDVCHAQVIGVESLNDTLSVESEKISNPFDVNHIPIRKNQANANLENLSFQDQLERHFSLISIVGLLILLAVIALRQRDFIGAILRSLLRDYALADFWRNESRGRSINLLAGYFFAIGSLALFLTLVIEPIQGYSAWKMYGLLLASIIGYFVVKHTILYFLKQIYSITAQVDYYTAQIAVTNIALGGVLFFLSVFLSFGPDSIQSPLKIFGFIVIIFALILQLGRTATHLLSDLIKHPFAYFVYLCALELSPILIILGLLSS